MRGLDFPGKIRMEHFITKDPRGFIVSCSEDCWKDHLITHPEIEGYENEAIKAIENPRHGYIFRSKHSLDRDIYYRKIPGRLVEIEVIVQFDAKNIGTVKSVHFILNRQKGELPIWPR